MAVLHRVGSPGGQCLLQLSFAAEACNRDIEPLLGENSGLGPDLGRPEGERAGHRLAEPDGVESK